MLHQNSIGDQYLDIITFSVVPITICHLLLGWPLQYNRWAQNDSRWNNYNFTFKGKYFVLHPLLLVRPTILASIPTLLIDNTIFDVNAMLDIPIFILTSVLDILATLVPLTLREMLQKYNHLCKDLLDKELPPMRHIQHRSGYNQVLPFLISHITIWHQ